ncbi:MAG: hypothetical protein Q7S34_03915 [bacterium]|nr:hypothetical protein [bacterium]
MKIKFVYYLYYKVSKSQQSELKEIENCLNGLIQEKELGKIKKLLIGIMIMEDDSIKDGRWKERKTKLVMGETTEKTDGLTVTSSDFIAMDILFEFNDFSIMSKVEITNNIIDKINLKIDALRVKDENFFNKKLFLECINKVNLT